MKLRSVCIILQNKKGEILLLLRDNNPSIQFPYHWVTLGGVIEKGETPDKAVKREIKEEIGLDLSNIKLFKKYNWPEKVEYVFYKTMEINPKEITLAEGQEIKFFKLEHIKKMKLAFHDNKIVEDFLKNNQI